MADDLTRTRRHFLTVATAVTGGVGLAAVAVPFLASFKPSARAQALGGPIEVDIGALEVGALLKIEWRGKPVWILRRTKDMLDRLDQIADELRDPDSEVVDQQPDYAKNTFRSVNPEYLVVIGACTHLQCSPTPRFEVGPTDFSEDWPGGFYCPCHGSKFDLAGRVYKGVPAPTNLVVPRYRFVSETRLLIGDDTGTA